MATEIGRQTLGANNPIRQAEFMQFLKSVPGLGISADAFRNIVDKVIIPQSKVMIAKYKHVQDADPATDNIQAKLIQYELDHPWYAPQAPKDTSKRVLGQIYENNGRRAKWTKEGWNVGQWDIEP